MIEQLTHNATGWATWLHNAQLAANLVIVAAILSVARVLWGLSATQSPTKTSRSGAVPPSPRLLVPFAALLALCGVSHLGIVIAGQSARPVLPTLMKLVAAALWVVTAVRFRSVVAHLLTSPAPRPECTLVAIATTIERLKIKIRMLETMIQHESWILDKSDALKELREILAELEAQQCQI